MFGQNFFNNSVSPSRSERAALSLIRYLVTVSEVLGLTSGGNQWHLFVENVSISKRFTVSLHQSERSPLMPQLSA